MKNVLKIGLIGCGVVGLRRISILPSNFKLIGCSDPFINLKKTDFDNRNLTLTKDWRKLINLKSLQAVIISTTHNLQSTIVPHSTYGVHPRLMDMILNYMKENDLISIHNLETESERDYLHKKSGNIFRWLKQLDADLSIWSQTPNSHELINNFNKQNYTITS